MNLPVLDNKTEYSVTEMRNLSQGETNSCRLKMKYVNSEIVTLLVNLNSALN